MNKGKEFLVDLIPTRFYWWGSGYLMENDRTPHKDPVLQTRAKILELMEGIRLFGLLAISCCVLTQGIHPENLVPFVSFYIFATAAGKLIANPIPKSTRF